MLYTCILIITVLFQAIVRFSCEVCFAKFDGLYILKKFIGAFFWVWVNRTNIFIELPFIMCNY